MFRSKAAGIPNRIRFSQAAKLSQSMTKRAELARNVLVVCTEGGRLCASVLTVRSPVLRTPCSFSRSAQALGISDLS